MSEGQLQRPRDPAVRPPRGVESRPAAHASWQAGKNDRGVTAYDEQWYQGRPQRP